jgi:hypothetical protein
MHLLKIYSFDVRCNKEHKHVNNMNTLKHYEMFQGIIESTDLPQLHETPITRQPYQSVTFNVS